MVNDPYQVLGVSHDADAETIKQAYRKLAKQYHPDLHPGDAYAAKRMNEINEAYEAIKNPQAYRQAQQQQQAWQNRQTYQTGNPFSGFDGQNPFSGFNGQNPFAGFDGQNPFSGTHNQSRWYYSGGNTQNTNQDNQENPFQWTVYRPRRRGSFLLRLIVFYFILQIIFSIFGGCTRLFFAPYYRTSTQADSAYSDYYNQSGNPKGETY